jgi:DNA-binding NarL/FixJ family response regulator
MNEFVVIEQAAPGLAQDVARELAAGAARVVDGWLRPLAGSRIVCVGTVATRADAAEAVLAAVGGAWLVVDATAPRDVIDQLCDDLRRLGRLDHRVGSPAPSRLAPEEQAVLALLLGGATLGQAAQALHISRRTADRRLAAARAALGVESTTAAMAAAARLGVRPENR